MPDATNAKVLVVRFEAVALILRVKKGLPILHLQPFGFFECFLPVFFFQQFL